MASPELRGVLAKFHTAAAHASGRSSIWSIPATVRGRQKSQRRSTTQLSLLHDNSRRRYNGTMTTPVYTTDTSDEAHEIQVEGLRRMTPQQRIAKTCEMSGRVRKMAFDALAPVVAALNELGAGETGTYRNPLGPLLPSSVQHNVAGLNDHLRLSQRRKF